MGHFSGGRLHEWGNPFALLKYGGLSLLARLRYGLLALVSTRRERWDALETQSAREWITRWGGREVYEKMWKPLFDLKFYEYADNVSAAWIWTRVKRIGRSRKSVFEEQLGYIEGGSETLVKALCSKIEEMGGTIRLSTPVTKVVTQDGVVTGVETPTGFVAGDAVICTTPTPLVTAMVPDLPETWKAKYEAIHNIGVCCLIFKLKRSVTPHFWVNITEPGIEIPGIIEFSNLRPVGDTIVFVPYYMPVSNEKFCWPDERLLDEAFDCIRRINPRDHDRRRPRPQGRAVAPCAADLRAGLRRENPAGPDPDRGDCRSPTPAFTTRRIAASRRACAWAKTWPPPWRPHERRRVPRPRGARPAGRERQRHTCAQAIFCRSPRFSSWRVIRSRRPALPGGCWKVRLR